MLKKIIISAERIYNFVMSVLLAVVLGAITWACWAFYKDVKLQHAFASEGQLVSVNVIDADYNQKSWRDILSNTAYLTVGYRGKAYPVRFAMDSAYVGRGDRVELLYHPQYNALRQPYRDFHIARSATKSRLIGWSTVSTFNDESKLLFVCLVLSAASFFLISGVIVSVVHWPFLQDTARLLLVLVLVIAALFFTYDTWQYVDYYQTLKNKGLQVSVIVLATDRIAHGRTHSRRGWRSYDYQASIRYQQQERIIPISEDDFRQLKPNDSLRAIYNESLNDFMSVAFLPSYGRLFIPLFFGLLAVVLMRKVIFWRNQPPVS